MDAVVRLRHVSKQYPIFDSPRDRLREALDPFRRTYHRAFWALRDINLDIPGGATVGILGVNGSGKSTLLKILCSVLQPSSGEVEVAGRVAALLELGAGFDRVLTGRANAEFHCMLNGYSRADMRDLLPLIESFADIGDFFDQPMQTYSSGMFMRVAFATAIHVDPDILIIDEALSVGDARFQQKCYAKFREFQQAGKTILVVTHDRFMVPRLCSHAILLHRGEVVFTGDPSEVTQRYSEILAGNAGFRRTAARTADGHGLDKESRIEETADLSRIPFSMNGETFDLETDRCPENPTYNKSESRYGFGEARIVDYCLIAEAHRNPTSIQVESPVDLWIKVAFLQGIEAPLIGFTIKTTDGILVYSTNSAWLETPLTPRAAGTFGIFCFSFQANLGPADWFLDLAVAKHPEHMCDVRENVCHFHLGHPKRSSGLVHLATEVIEAGLAAASTSKSDA